MSVAQDLPGFGVQMEKLVFKDDLDWLVAVRPPREVFLAQPTYAVFEIIFYIIGFLTLVHSLVVGGRWKYLWLAGTAYGAVTGMVGLYLPQLQIYWAAQSSVVLFGRQLPLHCVFAIGALQYICCYAVSHMKIPRLQTALAAGLLMLLIESSYSVLAVKFLHLTLHDTDVQLLERVRHTPLFCFMFVLASGTAFSFCSDFWRANVVGANSDKSTSFVKEILCVVLTIATTMPSSLLQLLVFYHPLHHLMNISTAICLFLMISLYSIIVWEADRSPVLGSRKAKGESTHWSVVLIVLSMLLFHGMCVAMATVGHPDNEISIGRHEKVGPCDKVSEIRNFGVVMERKTFLCTKNITHKYYDFSCTSSPPKQGSEWYTICGTKFDHRAEYVAMATANAAMVFLILYNLLFRSSTTVGSFKPKAKKDKKTK